MQPLATIKFKGISGVYMIRNKVNGYAYYGCTMSSLHQRIKAHRYSLNGGSHFNAHLQKAWDKYGPENFEFVVLVITERSEALSTEQRLLALVVGNPNCYNMQVYASAPPLREKATRKNGPRPHVIPRVCNYCGKPFLAPKSLIQQGRGNFCNKSCSGFAHTKHGHSRASLPSRTYKAWQNMIQQGSDVCESWRTFTGFLSDMGDAKEGQYLIRCPDNSGAYRPGNVQWATQCERARNHPNNKNITFQNRTQCAAAWAEELGVTAANIRQRQDRGLPPEQVLFNGDLRLKGASLGALHP